LFAIARCFDCCWLPRPRSLLCDGTLSVTNGNRGAGGMLLGGNGSNLVEQH
jgi:hypothetical protein